MMQDFIHGSKKNKSDRFAGPKQKLLYSVLYVILFTCCSEKTKKKKNKRYIQSIDHESYDGLEQPCSAVVVLKI